MDCEWEQRRTTLLRALQGANKDVQEEKTDNGLHQGRYMFSTGVAYEGTFKDGRFHGNGKLVFPGRGNYEGRWENGKVIEGKYTFEDGLAHDNDASWTYCTKEDRRFWSEICENKQFEDCSRLTNTGRVQRIPVGTYDVGDGYFDRKENIVFSYAGDYLRTASESEASWAIANCRIADIDTSKQ